MSEHGRQTIELERRSDGVAFLWLDMIDRPLNVLNRQMMSELDRALDAVASDADIQLLIVLSRKTTGFLAGVDLHEVASIRTAGEAAMISAMGQRLFHRLACVAPATVAIIHGPCLGGGLELALACDYRIVVDQRNTQIGLPEIELGLLPAWGGTQRLPRIIGIERALHVILMRRRLNAKDCIRWGLAQASCKNQAEAIDQAIQHFARDASRRHKDGVPRCGHRTWRQRILESTAAGRWLLFRGAGRLVARKTPDDMPAPHEALKAMRIGMTHGMTAGLAAERDGIGRLATTTACRNLMALFFLVESARKGDLFGVESKDDLKYGRIGVVGAGTMGAGIAQLAMVKGCDVVLREVNEELLNAGVQRVSGLFQKAVANGVLSEQEAREKLSRMVATTSWQPFADVDLAIEAVVEDLSVKRQVFQQLESHTRRDTVLATNTSSLSVSALQQGLRHPGRVVGLHFFNPVHKMPLVEMIRTASTDPAIASGLATWAVRLGKVPVILSDSPGFVVNRILVPYLNEAGMQVAEGFRVEDIDSTMRRFGMPMGPLELLDQVGLDVAAHVAGSIKSLFAGRLEPHAALEQMCAKGWLGQKSGQGFYRYDGRKKVVNREALAQLSSGLADGRQRPRSELREARARMVCLMVNEAALALQEGLADRAESIDLAMVLGTGWAPHRGGPLRYADDRGIGAIVEAMQGLSKRLGSRFEPCEELLTRARTNKPFYAPLEMAQSA
jgi:3-hydroxyacyl-CoA dehydrogenase/enoyl-CoA hydratase/3-hydroxybutyryl-CoA epimerase